MDPRSINWITDADLLDAPVTGVGTAKLYLLVRGRNAWHSTWTRRFRGTGAFHLTLAAAKADAELQRVQGSTFTIREVPALRLRTALGSVLAVEFHSNNCFGRYRPEPHSVRIVDRPLSYALLSLEGHRPDWTGPRISEHSFQQVCIDDNEPEALPPRKPLSDYTSWPMGTGNCLGWVRRKSDYSRQGINRIVRSQVAYQRTAGAGGLHLGESPSLLRVTG